MVGWRNLALCSIKAYFNQLKFFKPHLRSHSTQADFFAPGDAYWQPFMQTRNKKSKTKSSIGFVIQVLKNGVPIQKRANQKLTPLNRIGEQKYMLVF